jgi:hypothetical protein
MEEMISSCLPDGTLINSKEPVLSDTVPIDVLLINTLLPATGSPFTALITFPFKVACEKMKTGNKKARARMQGLFILVR